MFGDLSLLMKIQSIKKIVDSNNHSLDKVYNQTVKKVTEDFDTLSFNTAISQLMVFINECYKTNEVYKPYIEGFVKNVIAYCTTHW